MSYATWHNAEHGIVVKAEQHEEGGGVVWTAAKDGQRVGTRSTSDSPPHYYGLALGGDWRLRVIEPDPVAWNEVPAGARIVLDHTWTSEAGRDRSSYHLLSGEAVLPEEPTPEDIVAKWADAADTPKAEVKLIDLLNLGRPAVADNRVNMIEYAATATGQRVDALISAIVAEWADTRIADMARRTPIHHTSSGWEPF